MLVRLVVDWVQVFARSWTPKGPVLFVLEIVYTITDPPIRFVRRFVPPLRLGSVALDTSFLIVLVVGLPAAHPRRPELSFCSDARRAVSRLPGRARVGRRHPDPGRALRDEPAHHQTTIETKGEAMPLTPEDVSNKRFTPVRLREGYDMGEVDQFLDEVEAELARLTRENEDLRSKLSAAQAGAAAAPVATEPEPAERGAAGAGAAVESPSRSRRREPERSRRPSRDRAAPRRSRDHQGHHGGRGVQRRRPGCSSSPPATPTSSSPRPRTEAERIVGEAAPRPSAGAESKESDGSSPTPAPARRCSTRRPPSVASSSSATSSGRRSKLDAEVENLRSFEREYRSPPQELLRAAARGARRQRRAAAAWPADSATSAGDPARRASDEG